MRNSLIIILFCSSLLLTNHPLMAQDNKIGFGAMINSPTGLSAKIWIHDDIAIDGALSASFANSGSQLYLHSDVLQHKNVRYSDFMKYYYGLGFRLLWADLRNDLTSGIRGPIGVDYSFENTNIESFFEIVPTLDFSPNARFFFGGSVGMRVYLN